MKNAVPNIVYAFDKGFLYPTILSAFSVLKHRTEPTNITFLTTEEIPGLETCVGHLSRCFPDANLEILVRAELNVEIDSEAPLPVATYARLSLHKYFKGRVLYLDGDTLLRCDIAPLFNADLNGKVFGAVIDPIIERNVFMIKWGLRRLQRTELENHYQHAELFNLETYVNAGVLLIDLDKIDSNPGAQQFFDIDSALAFDEKYKLVYQDQDWINHITRGYLHHLPREWNTLWGNFRASFFPTKIVDRQEINRSRRNPALIHFTSRLKPWLDHGAKLRRGARPWDLEYKNVMAEMKARFGVDLKSEFS